MDSKIQYSTWLLIAVIAGIVVVSFEYERIAGAVVVGLGMGIVLIAFVPKLIPKEDRSVVINVLVLAIVLKFAALGIRLWVSESVYGYGDSEGYHVAGSRLAEHIRAGNFGKATANFDVGTSFIRLVTAFLYTAIGSAKYGGFMIFALMGLTGSMMFYRAFRIAFPSGDRRLYLWLVLLYPALLYWPTALGKDAPILLFSGLATYGIAIFVIRGRLSGFVFLAAGMGGAFLVRPSVTMILAIGLTAALLAMRPSANISSWVTKILILGIVLGSSVMLIKVGGELLEFESLTPDGIVQRFALENSRDYDATGAGSNFDVPAVNDPTWAPSAVMTVLLRPFPWETNNVGTLLQSVDGMLMGVILLVGIRRFIGGWHRIESKSLYTYVVVITVLTILVLGTLGNFGLLARQRASVLPFVFMAVAAVPLRHGIRRDSDSLDQIDDFVPLTEQRTMAAHAGD